MGYAKVGYADLGFRHSSILATTWFWPLYNSHFTKSPATFRLKLYAKLVRRCPLGISKLPASNLPFLTFNYLFQTPQGPSGDRFQPPQAPLGGGGFADLSVGRQTGIEWDIPLLGLPLQS